MDMEFTQSDAKRT